MGVYYESVIRLGSCVELGCRTRPLEHEGSIAVGDHCRLDSVVSLGDGSQHTTYL